MIVIARDEKGNKWNKEITFSEGQSGIIISFGWPCEYYIADLMKRYPFDKPLCIDMCGGNHKGSNVDISAEDMNKVMEFTAIKCWMFIKNPYPNWDKEKIEKE